MNGPAPEAPAFDLNSLLNALHEMRSGNFKVRLPTHGPGIGGRIAETFNEICATNQSIAQQLEKVGTVVGKEGRTRQRVKFGLSLGAWGEMESSVNTLIDDLLWPTAEVTRAVAAVAQQHGPAADRLVGELVDVTAGHAGSARHAVLDAGRDEQEVADLEAHRLDAGLRQPGFAVGDEVEDGVVLRGQAQAPRGGQLAVAVEALDQPQIAQDLGQGVVRPGPGGFVENAGLPRRSGAHWSLARQRLDDRLIICDTLSWIVLPWR